MFSVFVKYFSIIFLGIFLLSCIDGYAICPSTIKSIVTLQHNKRVREKKAKRQKEKMENERLENSACRKKSLFGEEFDPDERRTFIKNRSEFDPDKRRTFIKNRSEFDPDKRRSFMGNTVKSGNNQNTGNTGWGADTGNDRETPERSRIKTFFKN